MSKPQLNNAIGRLRLVALIEGISFVLLLLVAMPLKYFAGYPAAVKVTGMAHGVLFILFVVALLNAMLAHRWKIPFSLLVFLSSLLPFGPFLIDGRLKALEAKA